jgi:hypothetical protein
LAFSCVRRTQAVVEFVLRTLMIFVRPIQSQAVVELALRPLMLLV